MCVPRCLLLRLSPASPPLPAVAASTALVAAFAAGKKIEEYLGEEEASLVEFVTSKMSSRQPPSSILEELSKVLDDEAEV